MTRAPFERRKRLKLMLAVLATAIIVSALVAVALVFLGRSHPRF